MYSVARCFATTPLLIRLVTYPSVATIHSGSYLFLLLRLFKHSALPHFPSGNSFRWGSVSFWLILLANHSLERPVPDLYFLHLIFRIFCFLGIVACFCESSDREFRLWQLTGQVCAVYDAYIEFWDCMDTSNSNLILILDTCDGITDQSTFS